MQENPLPERNPHAKAPKQRPESKPETLKVVPLELRAAPVKKVGRPKKSDMPPMPALQMSDGEQEMYDYFLAAYLDENPDLTRSDKILLTLAGIEYIKYIRVASKELETGEVISMARQHPYTNMCRLLEQLSVTRRARKKAGQGDESDPARDEFIKFLNG